MHERTASHPDQQPPVSIIGYYSIGCSCHLSYISYAEPQEPQVASRLQALPGLTLRCPPR